MELTVLDVGRISRISELKMFNNNRGLIFPEVIEGRTRRTVLIVSTFQRHVTLTLHNIVFKMVFGFEVSLARL